MHAEIHIFQPVYTDAEHAWVLMIQRMRSSTAAAMGYAQTAEDARKAGKAQAAQLGLEIKP